MPSAPSSFATIEFSTAVAVQLDPVPNIIGTRPLTFLIAKSRRTFFGRGHSSRFAGSSDKDDAVDTAVDLSIQ